MLPPGVPAALHGARPGLCPRRRVLPSGNPCPNQCEDDRGCPLGQKCCFAGCGLECLRPRAGSTPLRINPFSFFFFNE
uniref:WAP domain-containing protein n=1 Tax=Pseudonaja textilis TaxID=8673 RepID=A0A670ZLV8_PSETE